MKTIEVTITGTTPLLMNSPKSMIEPPTTPVVVTTGAGRDPKVEAEKVAYRMENGELYVPSEAIKGTIVNAASYKKIGKYSAKPIISGGVFITPNEIPLGTKDYKIDIRTVVIRGSRVVKARPKLEPWKLKFNIIYNEALIGNPSIIKLILEEAGMRVGILDFRPIKNGAFGMFTVTGWQEVDTGKQPASQPIVELEDIEEEDTPAIEVKRKSKTKK